MFPNIMNCVGLFSQGSDHLTVSWKVHTAIYQHVDIREEGKENVFSLGKSLWIENEVCLSFARQV